MRQKFIDWKPQGKSELLVIQATGICADYQAQGYDLTLRQLYYQFVARDLIENTQRSYKRLGSIRQLTAVSDNWERVLDFLDDTGQRW